MRQHKSATSSSSRWCILEDSFCVRGGMHYLSMCGIIANQSIAALFAAGIVPGILMAVALSITSTILLKWFPVYSMHGEKEERERHSYKKMTLIEALKVVWQAKWTLLAIIWCRSYPLRCSFRGYRRNWFSDTALRGKSVCWDEDRKYLPGNDIEIGIALYHHLHYHIGYSCALSRDILVSATAYLWVMKFLLEQKITLLN
jgi:hypothetical protein